MPERRSKPLKTPCPCSLEIGSVGDLVVDWGSMSFLPILNAAVVETYYYEEPSHANSTPASCCGDLT